MANNRMLELAPPSPAQPTGSLLVVQDLVKHYAVWSSLFRGRALRAVDGINFELGRGETLGLVGESGCGKSTVARCVLRLVRSTSGRVVFDGISILELEWRAMQRLRRRMQIVFQDPHGSLNPRMLVRQTVAEPLRLHLGLSGQALDKRLAELMELVGLKGSHLNRYPHQLSGGQRQRVGIARAIATNPDLVILDEPTSSLDVSVQGQILQLLLRLQQELDLSYLFISHDLSVIRHIAQRVAVMYLGKIVEIGTVDEVFRSPEHPYTRALLSAVPPSRWGIHRERLRLAGEVPSPLNIPLGCRLSPRCPLARAACSAREPGLESLTESHAVACYAVAGWPEAPAEVSRDLGAIPAST